MQHDYSVVINSPVGWLGINTQGRQLCGIDFLPAKPASHHSPQQDDFPQEVIDQLARYFADPTHPFTLNLAPPIGTAFQHKVWQQLRQIPLGETRSYGDLAEILKTSPRAVGNACRHNPISIVVPCHRVVSRTGMGGFSGAVDGVPLQRKRWLLAHESGKDND